MDRYICVHGHFYQPPRENPWLEAIEVQDSAYPFHDWNERINAECYAPNTASRTVQDGRIINIVNNYSNISFNFGPTLLLWMEAHAADTYADVLEADRLSREKFSGHGSAVAQAYNHMIMPLANSRDKYTQVVWGIKDFRRTYGRDPEGMWLPETAVDLETLDIMAGQGITFTILAPRQGRRVRPLDDDNAWTNVEGGRIDPTCAYLCHLPSGRTINLFFYDGPISQGIAFENILVSGETFAQRLTSAFNDARGWPQLVHIATDGETYGHHHRFGDMALAYCLHYIQSNNLAKITNYAEYLERHPPAMAAEIFEDSSWSCVHGVERWRENCGCNSGMHPGWHQSWRRPLRDALDWLRDAAIPVFERESAGLLADPWGARNDYIDVINDRSKDNVEKFLIAHARKELTDEEKVRVLLLLGMQRCSQLMYTSCGWFFDEISGIETVQVLDYAARMIQLMEQVTGDSSIETQFVERIGSAPSNVQENGAKVYDMYVKPSKVDILRVAADYAISSLFFHEEEKVKTIYSYRIEDEKYDRRAAGRARLVVGASKIVANLTWEQTVASFAAAYFGDQNIAAGVRRFRGDEAFKAMHDEISSDFDKGDFPEVVRVVDRHFVAPYNYSMWHLFKDERRRVLNEILKPKTNEAETAFRSVYQGNYGIMTFLQSLGNPIPSFMQSAAQETVNGELGKIFTETFNIDSLRQLVNDANKFSITIDQGGIGLAAIMWVDAGMKELTEKRDGPETVVLMEKLKDTLEVLSGLPLDLDLWRAQNVYFSLREDLLGRMEERAGKGEYEAKRWVEAFDALGMRLGIKV